MLKTSGTVYGEVYFSSRTNPVCGTSGMAEAHRDWPQTRVAAQLPMRPSTRLLRQAALPRAIRVDSHSWLACVAFAKVYSPLATVDQLRTTFGSWNPMVGPRLLT